MKYQFNCSSHFYKLLLFILFFILFIIVITISNKTKTPYKNQNETKKNEKDGFIYPFDPNKYKKELETYYSELNKVPQIPLNRSIDHNLIRKQFHEKIKNKKVFDEKRIPYVFDFNLLLSNDEDFDDFTQEEIDDIIDYRLLLMRMYFPEKRRDHHLLKEHEKIVEKMYKKYHTYPKRDKQKKTKMKIPDYCNNRIDILWTYVNGSEINLKNQMFTYF